MSIATFTIKWIKGKTMENNINVSALAQNIAEQCKQFEESQEYKDMITNAVKKLYSNALDDVFRWGDFPDRVKAAIKEAMPTDVSNFVDLAKYNTLMMNTLKTTWEESGIQDSAVEQVQKATLKVISDMEVPHFVMLSDLLNAFIECNESEAAENNWEKPYVLCKESTVVSEYWEIAFEEEPPLTYSHSFSSSKRKTHGFEFKNCLNISALYENKNNKVFKLHDGHKCYELYAGKVDDDILGKTVVKPHSHYKKLICALYFGNAYLVWDDVDPDDIYYPHGD